MRPRRVRAIVRFLHSWENFADMANRYKTACQLVFQRRQKVHLHTVITAAAGTFESAVMPNSLMLRAFPDHVLQE